MNTDGFVKCNGKVLADKAKLYIELIQPENDRLIEEHRAKLVRRTDVYHRERAAACHYAQANAMTDLQEVLVPYYVNKTVKHGMLWWYRETIVSNLDLRAVWKNKDAIKDALIQKDLNFWRALHHVGIEALPDFSRCIEHTKDRLLKTTYNENPGHNWNYRPNGWFDISSLHQLLALDDTDVFLSIQNYNTFIAAADRYDELMQRKLEPLDAPLHQSN